MTASQQISGERRLPDDDPGPPTARAREPEPHERAGLALAHHRANCDRYQNGEPCFDCSRFFDAWKAWKRRERGI